MNNIYKVAIIGCGSIGGLKPDNIDFPDSENILTHAHAVFQHLRTELYAIIDINRKRLTQTKAKWQPQLAFRSFEGLEIHGQKPPDIVIVAVPTELHYKILHEIFISPNCPKLIIAEKPFCNNLAEANEISNQQKIPISVDYIRRFVKGYQEIKIQIDSGKFGKALNCRVLYTRGWKREASHAIDLMNWFFGKCLYKKTLKSSPIHDYSNEDPTISIFFQFEKCDNIVFQPCDGRKYGIFEVDICFETCRIRFIDNGLYYEIYPITEMNEWGHKSLNYRLTDVARYETRLNIALYNLIDNAVNFLDGKENLICTAEDAIAVHEILGDENGY